MQKYNVNGLKLLEYKKEYLNQTYSTIVHNSIGESIDMLFKNNDISSETHQKLKDAKITFEDFLEYLNEDPEFLLTTEELISKYNEISEIIKNKLAELIQVDTLIFEPNIEEDCVEMSQEFTITEEFLKNFFDISSDKDMESLMERKGFVEKFAILRLNKIAKEFLDEITVFTSDYKIFKTNTFFDNERNIYGIYIKYKISPDIFENPEENDETISTLMEKLTELMIKSEDIFVLRNILKENRVKKEIIEEAEIQEE